MLIDLNPQPNDLHQTIEWFLLDGNFYSSLLGRVLRSLLLKETISALIIELWDHKTCDTPLVLSLLPMLFSTFSFSYQWTWLLPFWKVDLGDDNISSRKCLIVILWESVYSVSSSYLSFWVHHQRLGLGAGGGQVGGSREQGLQLLDPVHAVHGAIGQDLIHHGHGLGKWHRPWAQGDV